MKPARDIRSLMQQAMAIHQGGDPARAEEMYREVLKTDPREPNAWHLLGVAAWQRGDLEAAETDIRKAIGYNAAAPAYYCNLGGVLKMKGDFEAAIATYKEALRLLPDYGDAKKGLAESYGRYGHALAGEYRWDEAKAAYRDLLAINPSDAGALNNLGQILYNGGESNEAMELYDRAVELRPDYLITKFNRGICRLSLGRFAEGWEDLAASTADWIPRIDDSKDSPWHRLPLWKGEDLRGKRILLWGDMGIGDEILYASMIPELMAKGAQVTLECTERLAPLFARSFPEISVIPRQKPPLFAADTDFHAPGLWLTRRLRPGFESFPAQISYLKADPKTTDALRARYASHGKKKIIGISWHSKTMGYGVHRRVALRELVASLPHKDVLYIDLQYGDTEEERAAVRREFPDFDLFHDPFIDQMTDLDNFAAQIAACDGVVTIGNTTAHVAGALGRTAAVLLPTAGLTWYWFTGIAKSPWYPSLAILRSDTNGKWDQALKKLPAFIASREALSTPAVDLESAHAYLSKVLQHRGIRMMSDRKLEEAKSIYRQVLEIEPNDTATLNNLAMITQHEGNCAAARALYDKAVAIAPNNLAIRYNRSLCALTEGRLAEGWADYAVTEPHWRNFVDTRKNLPWMKLPLWDGGDLRGKKILLWGDLGIGDEILYIGMVPDLIARGAHVTIECMDRLVPLVARSFPGAAVAPRQDPPIAGTDFDCQTSGMWLARWLRPTMDSFPHRVSFLTADAVKTARLRERYRAFGKKRIVGISWYTASWPWGLKRSVPLDEILSCLPFDDMLIVDLQYGDTKDAWAEAKRVFPALMTIHDDEIDQMKDMDSYAAQIAACDFVLTIGNTTSHVAGALGIPSCALLPDTGLVWYWFENGEKCPWYPSLALLRPSTEDRLRQAANMASARGS